MVSSVTDLSVIELGRPRSCDNSLNGKTVDQVLTCCASLDGTQCKICRSLVSLPSSSQLNDSQPSSVRMKRDVSCSICSSAFIQNLDLSITTSPSHGNTLKTLHSLTEEPTEDSFLSQKNVNEDVDIGCAEKIAVIRNVKKNNALYFPENLPYELYLYKESLITEEIWSSFIKQLNDIFLKKSSFSKGYLTCCFTSKHKKCKRMLENFIEYSNEKTFNPCGVQIKISDTDSFTALEVSIIKFNKDPAMFRIDARLFEFPR